jgi:glycosyltransferase involved in cell wall biosynthesis
VRAAPAVLRVEPDTIFVISGDGPERRALEDLARELSIEQAVRFLGGLPRDLNLRLIASGDVFCAVYDFSCVGVALLEAFGCGVASVVADTGATRDFVEHDVNGLVVAPDDADALAEALIALVTDPDLRVRLGKNARRRAEERFLTRQQRAALELKSVRELIASRERRRRRRLAKAVTDD